MHFTINEYTIFIFILIILIFLIVIYYSLLTHILERKIKELRKDKKQKGYVKHIKRKRL